jgi:N,N-dimethylformamidase
MGHEVDVVTDEDLHAEGLALLAPYKVVLTPSHPEYQSRETLDALSAYVARGGRLMYLGGNGFYWRVAVHPDVPGAVEIRRGEGGIRAWAAEPGEYYHAFDGSYGGLWRRNGRPPQQLVGVGFTSQAPFEGNWYRRAPGAADPRAAWILEGVGGDIIGDFGLSGGGAAGFELDRADHRLGTPPNTIVVASLRADLDRFTLVPEEMLTTPATAGEPRTRMHSRRHGDTSRRRTAGAVFSVGSITSCAACPTNNFDTATSRAHRRQRPETLPRHGWKLPERLHAHFAMPPGAERIAARSRRSDGSYSRTRPRVTLKAAICGGTRRPRQPGPQHPRHAASPSPPPAWSVRAVRYALGHCQTRCEGYADAVRPLPAR